MLSVHEAFVHELKEIVKENGDNLADKLAAERVLRKKTIDELRKVNDEIEWIEVRAEEAESEKGFLLARQKTYEEDIKTLENELINLKTTSVGSSPGSPARTPYYDVRASTQNNVLVNKLQGELKKSKEDLQNVQNQLTQRVKLTVELERQLREEKTNFEESENELYDLKKQLEKQSKELRTTTKVPTTVTTITTDDNNEKNEKIKSEYEDKILILQNDLKNIKIDYDSMKNENKLLNEKIKSDQSAAQIKKLIEEGEDLKFTISNLKKENEKLNSTLNSNSSSSSDIQKTYEDQIQTLKSEIGSLKNKISDISSEKDQIMKKTAADSDSLSQIKNDYNVQIKKLEHEVLDITTKYEDVVKDKQRFESSKEKEQQKFSEKEEKLRNELENIKKINSDLESSIDTVKKQSEKSAKESEKLKDKYTSFVEKSENEKSDLVQSNEILKKDIEILKAKSENNEISKNNLETQLREELEKEIKVLKKQNSELLRSVEKLKDELGIQEEEMEEKFETEIISLKTKNVDLMKGIELLKSELEIQKEELEDGFENEISNLRNTIEDEMKYKIEDIKKQNNNLIQNVEDLEQEKENLVKKFTEEIKILKKEILEIEKEKEKWNELAKNSEKEIEANEEHVENLEEKVKSLLIEISENKEKNENNNNENGNGNGERDKEKDNIKQILLKKEITMYKGEIQTYRNEIVDLSKKLMDAQKKIVMMELLSENTGTNSNNNSNSGGRRRKRNSNNSEEEEINNSLDKSFEDLNEEEIISENVEQPRRVRSFIDRGPRRESIKGKVEFTRRESRKRSLSRDDPNGGIEISKLPLSPPLTHTKAEEVQETERENKRISTGATVTKKRLTSIDSPRRLRKGGSAIVLKRANSIKNLKFSKKVLIIIDKVNYGKLIQVGSDQVNENDVFILDAGFHLFCWLGKNSEDHKRDWGIKVANKINVLEKSNHAKVVIVRSGDDDGTDDEFWNLLGGIPKSGIPEKNKNSEQNSRDDTLMQWDEKNNEFVELNVVKKKLVLKTNFCYLIDCYSEVYLWRGNGTEEGVRQQAFLKAVNMFRADKSRPSWSIFKKVNEAKEPVLFQVKFVGWE